MARRYRMDGRDVVCTALGQLRSPIKEASSEIRALNSGADGEGR
jgi:hypothetical protein